MIQKGPSRGKGKEVGGEYANNSTRNVPDLRERKGATLAVSLHTILYMKGRQKMISGNRKMRKLRRNLREKR